MRSANAALDAAPRPHRIVFENYSLRAPAFAMSFLILAIHVWDRGIGVFGWSALVLALLVYPHLVFWWARRAANSLRVELNNMVLDAFLIGLVTASLQFPFWITFVMWLACAMNNTLSRSGRGMLYATAAYAGGALIPIVLFGWRYAPDMGLPGTVLCALGMSLYLFAIGNANYRRNEQLRSVRARLRLREQSLEATNTTIEAAYRNISLMGEFGREITATLDRGAVMATVYRLVAAQMAADTFRVGIYREQAALVEFPFVMALGAPSLPDAWPLADAGALVRYCLEQGRPISIADHVAHAAMQKSGGGAAPEPTAAAAGALRAGSSLYAPLSIKDRVVGLLVVQSVHAHAYQPVHVNMLATLAAYTAVALDNADAYEQLAGALHALKGAQQQLVMNERMASIGTLTAGVAHEINNPVNFAHAGAQTLVLSIERFHASLRTLAGDDADTAISDLLERETGALLGQVGVIVEGTTRIRDIVRDLRNFSRLDEALRKTVSVNETLMSTVRLVRMHYARSTHIVCTFEREIVLECWPAQLNQVFMNLIINACDAVAERERSGAAQAGTPNGLLRIDARVEGGELVIDFDDNGCGIDSAAIGRIFDPFYTTKALDAGTGLGLAISYGIVRAHDGELSARSVPGAGSCFTVRMPLRPPPAAAPPG